MNPEKMTVNELKVLAYDMLSGLERLQRELAQINSIIQTKSQEGEKPAPKKAK